MGKKTSTYFPNYQLRRDKGLVWSSKKISFRHAHAGIYFTTRMPLFGVTKTQKAALKWAAWNTPPVVCVKHEAPVAPDKSAFRSHRDLHITYYPYKMAIAILECLGEEAPRKIKIYFCKIELHEDNHFDKTHSRYKGIYIVPLTA